ncbi:MAG: RNA ligase (ATP) [Propionibacteriaceae bacterium]|jgi:RNA ligase (TIGR02306 family)|nr:RNA ligase (ATP) [Propionibacteriaceae bacterium]
MLNDARVLATVGTIEKLRPIPDADTIEVGTVRGWDVVVKKGEYHDGDPVVYIEPDAALPLDNPVFSFLGARSSKKIDDGDYHVLRTARLRGQVSQGIVFPAATFADAIAATQEEGSGSGASLDELLGIILYEPPQPIANANLKGPWPIAWLRKTDAERVQNISDDFLVRVDDGLWIPTEKIDGSSITYWLDGDDLRVCSRNYELKTDDLGATPVAVAAHYDLIALMRRNGFDAIQGELYGDNVNGNRLKAHGHHVAVFAAWSLEDGRARSRFADLAESGLPLAPVIEGLPFPTTVTQALEQADGMKSLVNPKVLAEGIVWHRVDGAGYEETDYRDVWKAVSPRYLIKHGL